MRAMVMRPADGQVVERWPGVRVRYTVSPENGASEFLSGTADFDRGASVPLHMHNCEESIVILEGRALFECGRRVLELGPGDTTWIPASVPHAFANPNPEGLRIIWTYGRIDATHTEVPA